MSKYKPKWIRKDWVDRVAKMEGKTGWYGWGWG